jgi:hypothetical protein
MKHVRGIVNHYDREFIFEVGMHVANTTDQLCMEQMEYYQKYAGKTPSMPHIELEILTLPSETMGVELHIHPVNDKKFVCWTGHVPDDAQASWVFRIWCLGSIYTVLTGIPFEKYLFDDDIKGDSDAFESALAQEFHLVYID